MSKSTSKSKGDNGSSVLLLLLLLFDLLSASGGNVP